MDDDEFGGVVGKISGHRPAVQKHADYLRFKLHQDSVSIAGAYGVHKEELWPCDKRWCSGMHAIDDNGVAGEGSFRGAHVA